MLPADVTEAAVRIVAGELGGEPEFNSVSMLLEDSRLDAAQVERLVAAAKVRRKSSVVPLSILMKKRPSDPRLVPLIQATLETNHVPWNRWEEFERLAKRVLARRRKPGCPGSYAALAR